MYEFVQRACAHPPDEEGALVHTPSLAWWVHAVRRENEFQGLAETGFVVQRLDAYGEDGWDVLAQSGLFELESLETVRESMLYDERHFAFVPEALCTTEEAPFAMPARMTREELQNYNERVSEDLSQGRFQVSKAGRHALGTGECKGLYGAQGVCSLALMELRLSPQAWVLGWGWLWAAAG